MPTPAAAAAAAIHPDDVKAAARRIRNAVQNACDKHDIRLVALSGGLDSSIIAWQASQSGSPAGIAVVAKDFISPDLEYCQIAAASIGMRLSIAHATAGELLDYARETVRILENFNEIEIRNNIVMYAAAKWAAENGYDAIATGDGADELFAGYKFMINAPQERLASEIKRICSIMHFPSHKICKSLGVTAISPFLDYGVVSAATGIDPMLKVREDAKIKARQQSGVDGIPNEVTTVRYGKWILRKAFEHVIPQRIAWRPKAAMQDGSGTAGLTGLLESAMHVGEASYTEKIQKIRNDDGVIIRSRESLCYYEMFREMFGTPAEFQGSPSPAGSTKADDTLKAHDINALSDTTAKTVPLDAGPVSHAENRRCPYCRYVIQAEARFCRMCAAFPI